MTKVRGWLNGGARWLLPVGATLLLGVGSWLLTASAQSRSQARVDVAAAIEIESRLTRLETIVPAVQESVRRIEDHVKDMSVLLMERFPKE
jgi:hypothetical protein